MRYRGSNREVWSFGRGLEMGLVVGGAWGVDGVISW